MMMWILLATGFTGALTLVFLVRFVYRAFGTIPSSAVYFSPKGGATEAVLRELKAARREVLVLAYSFSSKPIAEALVEAKTRGVQVEIILDRSNEQETYSDLALFEDQGLAPLIDAQHAIAHNKLMIIDQRTLITGSFNFTHQAEAENAENLLILKGHPELLKPYRQNFLTHKSHSQVPNRKPAAAAHRTAA
ncbi:MAG TPA: phospholipase D family protein [Gemmataceae bacterium]|nr:phospholipase D family protein [Gemmataceae bacterium]